MDVTGLTSLAAVLETAGVGAGFGSSGAVAVTDGAGVGFGSGLGSA